MSIDINAIYTTIEGRIQDNWIDTPINKEFSNFDVNLLINKEYIKPTVIIQKTELQELSYKIAKVSGVLECKIISSDRQSGTLLVRNLASKFINLFNGLEFNNVRFFGGTVGQALEQDNKLYMNVIINFEINQGV